MRRTPRIYIGALACVTLQFMLLGAVHAQRATAPLSLTTIDAPAAAARTLLTDNANEAWYFVPDWADDFSRRLLAPPNPAQVANGYRAISPFVVRNPRGTTWSSVSISPHAHAVYPVQRDPYNDALI